MAAHSVSPVTSHGVISHLVKDTSTHPSTKLKLQLFPIDEFTRKALEKVESEILRACSSATDFSLLEMTYLIHLMLTCHP